VLQILTFEHKAGKRIISLVAVKMTNIIRVVLDNDEDYSGVQIFNIPIANGPWSRTMANGYTIFGNMTVVAGGGPVAPTVADATVEVCYNSPATLEVTSALGCTW
jgi:hypothetical protein